MRNAYGMMVAVIVLFCVPVAQADPGDAFVPGEIVVRIKETGDASSLSAQKYTERAVALAVTLDRLKREYSLTDERPVFSDLHAQMERGNKSLDEVNAVHAKRRKNRARRPRQNIKAVDLFPVYRLKTRADVAAICEKLKADPAIEYAEPNYIATIQASPVPSGGAVPHSAETVLPVSSPVAF